MGNFFDQLFETAGIQKGDILDVASDLLSLMLRFQERHEAFDANQLLDALQRAVGEEGTILIRTFNWDFCHGVPFNYKTTRSRVGVLGNVALKRADFKRTKHPLYSWCVWGKEQKFLTEIDPADSFGDDSIFAILEEKNAKFLRIGDLQGDSLTCVHLWEERAKLPVRYIKQFTGQYIDADGSYAEKTYSMFVRDLDYRFIGEREHIEKKLNEKEVVARYQYDGVSIDWIDIKKLGIVYYADILDGKWGDWVRCEKISQT